MRWWQSEELIRSLTSCRSVAEAEGLLEMGVESGIEQYLSQGVQQNGWEGLSVWDQRDWNRQPVTIELVALSKTIAVGIGPCYRPADNIVSNTV